MDGPRLDDFTPDAAPPGRRADARRNRRLILHAARDCFAEFGTLVPIEEIALRAGVGKGTLYRHFSTRHDLIESVAEQFYLEAHRVSDAALAEPDPWEGLRMSLIGVAECGVGYDNVLRTTSPDPPSDHRREMSATLHVKLDRITQRAVDAGVARPGLTGHDVALLSRMLAGAQGLVDQALGARDWRRLTEIALSGMRAPRR